MRNMIWGFLKVDHERKTAIHHRRSTSGCRMARKSFGANGEVEPSDRTACLLKGKCLSWNWLSATALPTSKLP